MPKSLRTLALMVGLGLFAFASPSVNSQDNKVKPVIKEILEIAADLEAGKDVVAKVKAFRKKHDDLDEVMHGYKPRMRGGVGVDPKADAKSDGVEMKFNAIARRAMAPAALKKEKDLLLKAAYFNLAMAKLTKEYAPEKPKGGKGAKEWNKLTDEMEKGTKDMLEALKKEDPAALKKAVTDINNACNTCHSDFRDA
ncbi:MAG: cytochrome c [Gemmataceae bacterium]